MAERIKYLTLSESLLYDPDLKAAEKVLVGLVQAFSGKGGLRLSNRKLGKIIGMNATNVSRVVSRLQRQGWIIAKGRGCSRRLICAQSGAQDAGKMQGGGAADRPGKKNERKKIPTNAELESMRQKLGL